MKLTFGVWMYGSLWAPSKAFFLLSLFFKTCRYYVGPLNAERKFLSHVSGAVQVWTLSNISSNVWFASWKWTPLTSHFREVWLDGVIYRNGSNSSSRGTRFFWVCAWNAMLCPVLSSFYFSVWLSSDTSQLFVILFEDLILLCLYFMLNTLTLLNKPRLKGI